MILQANYSFPILEEEKKQQEIEDRLRALSSSKDELEVIFVYSLLYHPFLHPAFLAIKVLFCRKSIFCNCFLAFARFDFDVPTVIFNCFAISSCL